MIFKCVFKKSLMVFTENMMNRKIVNISRIVLFVILGFSISATEKSRKPNPPKKTWDEAILVHQKTVQKQRQKSTFKPYQSPELKIGDPSLKVNVDVKGMPYLKLVVNGSIDGNAMDYAVWVNARFTDKKGQSVAAGEVKVWKEMQGSATLAFDGSPRGNAFKLDGKHYEEGIAMQADGYAIFKLDEKYLRFEAEIGIEQNGGDDQSSMVFKVYDYLPDLLFERLIEDFPSETRLFMNYAKSSSVDIFQQNAGDIIKYVAGRLHREYGIVDLVNSDPSIGT